MSKNGLIALLGALLVSCGEWEPPEHPLPSLITHPMTCASNTGLQRKRGNEVAWKAMFDACNRAFPVAVGFAQRSATTPRPVQTCLFTYLPETRTEAAVKLIQRICRSRGTPQKPVAPSKYDACLLSTVRDARDDEDLADAKARCNAWAEKPGTTSGFKCVPFEPEMPGCERWMKGGKDAESRPTSDSPIVTSEPAQGADENNRMHATAPAVIAMKPSGADPVSRAFASGIARRLDALEAVEVVAEDARDTRISHLLRCSISTTESGLTATAMLLDTDTGLHLWSQAYSGEAGTEANIQEKIVSAIDAKLRPSG